MNKELIKTYEKLIENLEGQIESLKGIIECKNKIIEIHEIPIVNFGPMTVSSAWCVHEYHTGTGGTVCKHCGQIPVYTVTSTT